MSTKYNTYNKCQYIFTNIVHGERVIVHGERVIVQNKSIYKYRMSCIYVWLYK